MFISPFHLSLGCILLINIRPVLLIHQLFMHSKYLLTGFFILSFFYADQGGSPMLPGTGSKNPGIRFADRGFNRNGNLKKEVPFWETKKSNPQQTDTAALKQSNWYADALKQIESREYNIAYREEFKSYTSPNRRNNLRAFYSNNAFVLTPRNDSFGKWKLTLSIDGIYSGKKKLLGLAENPQVSQNGNSIRFSNTGSFITEYVNSQEGVRQNFIIPTEPAGKPQKIAVKMKAGRDWFVNRVDKKEIHFAKAVHGGYEKKISYNGLKVWDAQNRELDASFTVFNNTISIEVLTANAVYPITIDPVSTTPSAQLEINQVNAFMGVSVASAGDVNKDGYSDVIVGAQLYDNGQTDEGAAFVYHGSATGISNTIAAQLEGNQAGAYMGYAVSSAGDVNGDGYSDVIVGASNYDDGETDEGAAFVFHGSASGINPVAVATVESNQSNAALGISVASAGDVNGDGYSDVIVGAYFYDNGEFDEGAAFIYHGSAAGINTAAAAMVESNLLNTYMGISVAGAGDVNGDGFSDVIVGAYGYSNGQTNEGAAYVYHGSAGGINTTVAAMVESNQGGALMGNSVSSAGDVNGDGYSDVIVCVSSYDNGQSDEGGAFIYHGSASGINTTIAATIESNQAGARMGLSGAPAGDINGDGYSDIIIGAMYYDNGQTDEGAAFVYAGSASGINTTAIAQLESNQVSALMGCSVACAGDVNGDGFSDLIVGAYSFDNGQSNEGAAFVYHGSASGINTASSTIMESNQASADFGFSVACAGDVNGDGYSDVIVGAYLFDNGQTDEGAAFVYHGSASGITTTIAAQLEMNQANARMGCSVAGAGDVNGDGYSDVIVGSYLYDNGQSDEGAAFIYHGSAAGINTTLAASLESNQFGADLGSYVAGAGDVNGDGYSDIIVAAFLYDNGQADEGVAFIYHGSATGINTTASALLECNQATANMGSSVAGAGDVNGDGYSDVIVGAKLFDNGQTNEGAFFVYHGSATGINTTAAATVESNQANAALGYSVAGAGDVNGDGYSDIIVGAIFYTNGQSNEGGAFIYHGSAIGINTTPALILENNIANALMGNAVSSAGDVNGDGYSDVIVGALNYTNGQSNEGAFFLYQGSATGINATAAATAESNQASANMGFSVACAGDVNGDGYSDVIIGADLYNNGQATEGVVFVYLGNNGGGKRSNIRLYNTDLTTPIQRSNYNNPNLFGAGLFARSPLGRVKGKLVWEVKPQGQPFSGNPISTSVSYYDKQTSFTNLGIAGTELKSNMQKRGRQTKVRARIEYDKVTAITGQVYGPWRYPPGYTMGAYGMNAVPLPLTLIAFAGQFANTDDVQLQWITANELSINNFTVERSIDGLNFITAGEMPAKGMNGNRTEYALLDKNVKANLLFYRLKIKEQNGDISYSNTISLSRDKMIKGSIAPNPVQQGSRAILSLYSSFDKVPVSVLVVNSAGQVLRTEKMQLKNGTNEISIKTTGLQKGIYLVNVQGENIIESYKLVVE